MDVVKLAWPSVNDQLPKGSFVGHILY